LRGSVESLGDYSEVAYFFQWKDEDDSIYSISEMIFTNQTNTPFSINVLGLTANTTYDVMFCAQTLFSLHCDEGQATTLADAEYFVINTNDATNIQSTSFTMNGNLSSMGDFDEVTLYYQYKPSSQFNYLTSAYAGLVKKVPILTEDYNHGLMQGGVTIEDDVKRRDLTYNALFYDLDKKEIIDLTGGRKDLDSGVTRMVGDPIERFDEDSLRILRAFRFASRYGHPLHIDTEKAINKRKQLENIDPDSGDMKRISQERIWDEMKKAWKQAKDYNHYLDFFTKYDMWSEVFPGSNINTDLVDSKNFAIVIANLFKNENTNQLENRLVQDYRIENDLAKKVVFLISFLNFTPEDVFDFYKKRQQSGIDDTTILEWLDVNDIDDEWMIKFVNYKPTVSSEELMKKGFKGADLGREIKRLEIEKFTEL
jgi:hypothetical protein